MERLRNALRPGGEQGNETVDPKGYSVRFIEAMDDDLNTPRALAALFDLVRDINRGREEGLDVGSAQETLKELTGVLGLTLREPQGQDGAEAEPFIQLLVDIRSELRDAKQYELGDSVRKRLAGLGVVLEDTPKGTEWRQGLV